MRFAVQSPYFLFADPNKNFTGYDFEFFKLYKPAIYFPGWRKINLLRVYKRMKELGLNPQDYSFVFSIAELNRKADVLLGFCGRPDLPALKPPKKFKGLKIYHVMDYVFQAEKCYDSLKEGGVDYVMGYTNHGEYCTFFRKYYPDYSGKVIPVPFGFGERFKKKIPFQSRIQKCIAAGSVNPVDDPVVKDKAELREYKAFYADEKWTHKWRYMLAVNESSLSGIMDSVLPKFPETKNPFYDAVELFNKYQLFANDIGLMAFPPARTYEGIASGTVMVGERHPCYKDLGFKDGVNCLLHSPQDLEGFRKKINDHLRQPKRLEEIAEAGYSLVVKKYSHKQIAQDLFQSISRLI